MAISFSEHADLACPACGAEFKADVWSLVDAAERPDLADALRDGTLNVVACSHCGAQAPAAAPLLYHDPANRRVYFAVPPDRGEHIWREQAQALLYALVGALPEDARLPYLGDVQVEHEVAGVRRALLRRARGRAPARPAVGKPVESILGSLPPTPPAARVPEPPPADQPQSPDLVEAVQALLAADDEAEFESIVAANPALLADEGDAVVYQLAELAYGQGQRAVSEALRELRATLARMRTGAPALPSEPATLPAAEPAELGAPGSRLTGLAYQALLQIASPAALHEAARDYPLLLEPWADAELAARTEAALDEGNERLAQAIEDRREALAALREQVSAPDALRAAVRALIEAEGEDPTANVLAVHPILLTDTAQVMLGELAAAARAQGQTGLAEDAARCRTLLANIRAGLDAA